MLARNNFGDAKLLIQVNKAILNKLKELTTVDMTMLMGFLYELDRVTVELDVVFRNYFEGLSKCDTTRTVTSFIKASWTFLQTCQF